MITLRNCYKNEIILYCDIFIENYSNDLIKNHQLDRQQAYNKAVNIIKSSFPDNKPEKNHSLYIINKTISEKSCNIGYIWILETPGEQSIFIMDFYILQKYRNKKLGFESLQKLMSELEVSGIKSVKLRVEPDNIAAIRLYERIGFYVTGINMSRKTNSKDCNNDISEK
ncbi:GNAT family N-acetyltransferase [Xenorhabdus bovienii]|uniref:GCN5-related N-acetyltransferase n=1 Tax=Xenorhabdus bovienii str. kraussei Becker Underwood TaxID=1398204 RepID=A0A077PR70_XENBV|nr:GNAT family N-acetyltransferase [Xenorhabdus bovienii]CDH26800.1 GCN5-related N-acetyltransferase [Xenorhabdus bovienii str. kraussei Becker Underwood]